jgi:peroxiredoxin
MRELILYLVLFGLLVEVNVLVFRITRIQERVSSLEYRIDPPRLKAGETVPELTVSDLEGRTHRIGYPKPGEKVLLFFLSTRCPVCEKNVAIWNRLAGDFAGAVFGIVNDTIPLVRQYRSEKGIRFPLVVPDSARVVLEDYKIRTVPQTLVIGEKGTVEGVWGGLLAEESAAAIRQKPGLPDLPEE